MAEFNISQFKQALVEARERERARLKIQKPALAPRAPRPRPPSAVEDLIKPALVKSGLDVTKLDQVLAHKQAQARQLFDAHKAEAAKIGSVQNKAFHGMIDQAQEAIQYLAKPPADVHFELSNLVSLTTPFLIWEWPLDESLVDTHIEPLRSRARINLDIPIYSFDDDSGNRTIEYSFYFFWQNSSPFLAVVKCFSVLALNGACRLEANAGIFSGDRSSLTIEAHFFPLSFWIPLQPGQDIRSLRAQGDPLQSVTVLNNLTATGGHIFGNAGHAERTFSNTSVGVSFGSFGGFSIPGNSTAVFEVNLKLIASWDGNTLPDEIVAEFADQNLQHSVECPIVVLQFLTQPPVMA